MRRRAALVLLTLAVLALLLALDLNARGLAWQLMWSQTGEEGALAQMRGMVEVAGNLVRHPLQTDPLAAIAHKTDAPYGINTFLQQEVERPKIEAMLRMIREAGFTWLRQEFPLGRSRSRWARTIHRFTRWRCRCRCLGEI